MEVRTLDFLFENNETFWSRTTETHETQSSRTGYGDSYFIRMLWRLDPDSYVPWHNNHCGSSVNSCLGYIDGIHLAYCLSSLGIKHSTSSDLHITYNIELSQDGMIHDWYDGLPEP